MKRKLIKQGISALTITLPTKWAEKLILKPIFKHSLQLTIFYSVLNKKLMDRKQYKPA
ncbi:hypothetical protein HYU07_05765 [Candidatus Woesearchaeota archaeon]|nr:hypothetical protein [Candidatus Woesearchaeota archaeon]